MIQEQKPYHVRYRIFDHHSNNLHSFSVDRNADKNLKIENTSEKGEDGS